MTVENATHKNTNAVLVGVQLPGVTDAEHAASMAELGRLVQTLGFPVVGKVSQKRKNIAPGSVVGEGKLKDLAAYTGGPGVIAGFKNTRALRAEKAAAEAEAATETDEEVEEDDTEDAGEEPKERAGIVVFDCELSPTQLKNVEEASGAEVLDRTGVILEIFSRHARSREARLQVEIAKLGYMAPRLRTSAIGEDRKGGGIGAKGAGESAHELDKRRIRDRISELRAQLVTIHTEQGTRRSQRNEVPCVALVGYTNAGKSSLMRALTGSEVLVADKLFATLDTTVRAMQPETTPRILISDTVGFIKKLPHELVASFRSTLDEAHNASLLLFTVDAADPTFRSQLEVTQQALKEIEADEIPSRLVLNKIDCLSKGDLARLRTEFPEAIFISALNPGDIKSMKQMIIAFFEKDMCEETLFIPYTKSKIIGELREHTRVLDERHTDEGSHYHIRASQEALDRMKKLLARA